jgi:peptidoglycan/LPS O-acetylase OafA/YrhL
MATDTTLADPAVTATGSRVVSTGREYSTAADSSPRLKTLDGLRGLAICSVILFHANIGFDVHDSKVAWLSAVARCGWIGVDLFFVLSGFLITGILLDTRHSKRYLTTFFARRMLRIFPLYYSTLFAVFIVLPWFVPPASDRMMFLYKHQAWFWTYFSNIGYVVEQKAFGNADWLWLDHFWSLALEEQFYVIWPFVVWKLSARRIVQICCLMICGSLFLRTGLSMYGLRASALYFPTPCRLDGLASGAIAAVLLRFPAGTRLTRRLKELCFLSTAVLLTICIFRGGLLFDDHICLTIGLTALAVAGAGLITWAATSSSGRAVQFLEHPILGFFGKYSYGMYVLHHLLIPVIFYWLPAGVLVRYTGSAFGAAIATTLLTFLLSVSAGLLSWHLLEKHCLKWKSRFIY